ncbi:MAG: hypothetical protein ACJAS4_000570 [Bacteriovoracaceae bacterium]|jgi:hypothetical protein
MLKSSLFIFILLFFGQIRLAESQVLDFFKGHIKSYNYEFETSENYEFESCQEFNSDNDFEYYLTCVDGQLVKEKEFNHLLNDIRAVETKVVEEAFLEDLKLDILSELKRNKLNVKKQKKCIGILLKKRTSDVSIEETNECNAIQAAILKSIQTDLPQIRVLMGQKDTPGHIYSSSKPERFQRTNLVHEVNKRKAPDLSKNEAKILKSNTDVLERAFIQDILSTNLNRNEVLERSNEISTIDKLLPCFGEITSNRCKTGHEQSEIIHDIEKCINSENPEKLEIKSDVKCKKFHTMLSYKVNNRFDKQNIIYKKEYNKKISGNPLLTSVPLTGEETPVEIFEGVYSVLDQLEMDAFKAIRQVSKLADDDRKDLLGFNVAVEKFLKERGPTQIMCDVGSELKGDRDFSEMKTDLFIGGAALIGGGVCALSYGLGCAAGVAIGIEVGAVGISQGRLNNAKIAFNAGLTDAQKTLDRESERNLSMYLAPLALVGEPGKLIIHNASKVGSKLIGRKVALKQSTPVDNELLPAGNSRRYDFEKRKTLDDIEKSIGGNNRSQKIFNRYYPNNKYNIDNGDKIYIAAIAKDLEKDIRTTLLRNGLKPESKLFKSKLRKDVQEVLDSIASKCNGK